MCRSNKFGWITFRIVCIGATAFVLSLPAFAVERLRETLDEYQRVAYDVKRHEFRQWIDRLNRAIAGDSDATGYERYVGRRIQVSLCNGLDALEESLKYADEAVRLAPTPEIAFDAGYSAASVAVSIYRVSRGDADASRALKRLTDLQTQVERSDGLMAKSTQIEIWGPLYVSVLITRAEFLEERGSHAEALSLYEQALKLISERRVPGVPPAGPDARERAMYRGMVCAARCKNTARSEQLLEQLHELPGRRGAMLWYVEELARAEAEQSKAAYAARLSWWLSRTNATDSTWPHVLLELAKAQSLEAETRPEAVSSFSRLLGELENRPPQQGVDRPAMQTECWYQLAWLYAEGNSPYYDPAKVRRFSQLYFNATESDRTTEVVRRRSELKRLLDGLNPIGP